MLKDVGIFLTGVGVCAHVLLEVIRYLFPESPFYRSRRRARDDLDFDKALFG